MVERSFAWLSRFWRLNIIFERSKEHLIAFVAIAFISIVCRRLKRLAAEDSAPDAYKQTGSLQPFGATARCCSL